MGDHYRGILGKENDAGSRGVGLACALITQRINGTGAIMVGFVHNEIVVEAPIVMEDEIYEILRERWKMLADSS